MSIKITALPFAAAVIPSDILPIVQFGLPNVTKRVSVSLLLASVVPNTRIVTAGDGMTGGGNLSGDITLDVVANADGSIVVNPNDIQVGALATDAQHGIRGGGTQHALVIPAGAAGFMSGADKTKLDGLTSGANSAFFMWGNQTISPTTTVRWLDPSYNTTPAGIVAIVFATPIGGTVKNMRVTQVGGGNGNIVTYTLFVNGIATALVVNMASTAVLGTDLVNSVIVVAGDLLELRVTKAINIAAGPTQVIATMLLQGP